MRIQWPRGFGGTVFENARCCCFVFFHVVVEMDLGLVRPKLQSGQHDSRYISLPVLIPRIPIFTLSTQLRSTSS